MTFDPVFLGSLTLVLTAFGGAFLAALWISLVVWTYRDIRARARDPLTQTLAALLVAVLNLPGVLVYLILRPPRTLEEEYQRTLEEEALLQALEDLPLCPGCERRVKEDWQVCTRCCCPQPAFSVPSWPCCCCACWSVTTRASPP